MKTLLNKYFTSDQIKNLPKGALAKKYKCTPTYIRQVLDGTRVGTRSHIATKIKEDAQKILDVLK